MLFAILKSLRPKQWIKNLLIFVPLVFSREFLNLESFKLVSITFGIFCLTASGVYLMNDVFDKKNDTKHPHKKQRAIASGKLPVTAGVFLSLLLLLASFFFAWKVDCVLLDILLVYLVLQLAYSSYFKHVVILDLIFIAMGFIVRIFAGGMVIGVEVSSWLLAITFLLALLLASGKRLRETEIQGVASRKVLESYPPNFLKSTIKVLLPAILVSYLFYSFQANNPPNFIWTAPIAVFGLLRYLFLIDSKKLTEDPTELLLTDKPLLASVILWVATSVGILMFG